MLAWLVTGGTVAHAQSRRDTDVRSLDANVDRVILSPTAETHPQGTFFGSVYEFVLPQVGFAPNQRMQLSLTGFSDLKSSFVLEATLKANLLRTRTLRIASITAIDVLRGDGQSLVFGRLGATAQWCFEDTCASSVNVSGMVLASNLADVLLPFGAAVGFIGRLSGGTKLLLEYGTLSSFSNAFGLDAVSFWYAGYGLRFFGRSWGFDLVMIRQLDMQLADNRRSGPNLIEFLGFPLLVFTYRFGHN